MATVGLSDELTRHIIRNASRPFNNGIVALTKLSPETSMKFYRDFMVSEDQANHLDAIPAAWLNMLKRDEFNILIKKGENNFMHFAAKTSQPVYLHNSWRGIWRPGWTRNVDDTPAEQRAGFDFANGFELAPDQLKFAPEEMQLNYKNAMQLIKERNKFIESIQVIFDRCKTLNQAVKIWPGILHYVTKKEYLERLERKATRKTAESVGLDQDKLDELNITCITHRMAT